MKKLLFLCLVLSQACFGEIKISQLPLGSASTTGNLDSFPYVNTSTAVTERLLLSDLPNLPAFQTAFESLVPVFNVKIYGASGDGITNDTPFIQNAIDAATSGGVIYFPAGTYKINTALSVTTNGVTFQGEGIVSELKVPDGNTGVSVRASDFTFDNMWVDGGTYTSGTSTGKLLDIEGTDANHYLSRVKIKNSRFTNATFYALYIELVQGLEITNNEINDTFYAAIASHSILDSRIVSNKVTNVLGENSNNSYGISVTLNHEVTTTGTFTTGSTVITSVASTAGVVINQEVDGNGAAPGAVVTGVTVNSITMNRAAIGSHSGTSVFVSNPISKRVVIADNQVYNVTYWEGIDVHAAESVSITGNAVTNCWAGINAGDAGATMRRAPKHITISGNSVKNFSATDNTHTITATGTAAVLSGSPSYVLSIGDLVVVSGVARYISALSDQTHFTLNATFSPDPSSAAVIVTQKGKGERAVGVTGSSAGVGTPFDLAEDITITGNTFAYSGNEFDAPGLGSYFRDTKNLTITGNSFIEPDGYAIFMYYDNYGFNISSNTVVDPYSWNYTAPGFLFFSDEYQYGTIVSNTIKTYNASLATYVLQRGINYASSLTNADLTVSANYYDGPAANYQAGLGGPPALLLNPEVTNPYFPVSSVVPSSVNKTWNIGQVVLNSAPAIGSPLGWMNSASGAPGTWVTLPYLGMLVNSQANVSSASTIIAMSSSDGFKRITGATNTALQGIVAGAAGQTLSLYNASTGTLTIQNLNGGANPANQIITATGADISIAVGGVAEFIYSGADTKWICKYASPAITNWTAWTPTGSWITNTTYTGVYRLQPSGRSVEVFITVALSGAPNATQLVFTEPIGPYNVNWTVFDTMVNSSNVQSPIGQCKIIDPGGGNGNFPAYIDARHNAHTLPTTYGLNDVTGVGNANIDATHPFTFATGQYITCHFEVPI